MGPKRSKKKQVEQEFGLNNIAQSQVKQYQGSFNLMYQEFNERDYALQNWIHRKYTLNDYKKEFSRQVNGNQKPVKFGDEPQWFFGLADDDDAQKMEMQRSKRSKLDTQSLKSLDHEQFNISDSMLHEDEFTISDKNQNDKARSLQQSSVTIDSNVTVASTLKMNNNLIQIESEEDSSELYYVSQKKTKKNNINLQEQDKQTHGPGLSSLIFQSLQEKYKKKPNKQYNLIRKLQKNQTKKPFLVPQQDLIKLDD